MVNAQQFIKDRLDLTPEEVIGYFKRHKIRCIACGVCFLLEFIASYLIIKRAHWDKRGFLGKGFVFCQILVLLVLLEISRWCDVVIELVNGSQRSNGSVTGEQKSPNTTPTEEQEGDAKSPEEPKNSNETPSEEDGDAKSPEEPKNSNETPSEEDGDAKSPEEPKNSSITPTEEDGDAKSPEEPKNSNETPSEEDGDAKSPEEPKNSSITPSEEDGDAKSPEEQKNSEITPSEEEGDAKSSATTQIYTPSLVENPTETLKSEPHSNKSPPIEDAKQQDIGKALDEILEDSPSPKQD